MKIGEIMHRKLIIVDKEATIAEAAKVMDNKNIGCVLVEENKKIAGIMTERDILKRVVAAGLDYRKAKVKDIMSPNLITAPAETTLEESGEIMERNKIRRLIVTENNEIAGIITSRDVIERMKYSFASTISKNRHESYHRPSFG